MSDQKDETPVKKWIAPGLLLSGVLFFGQMQGCGVVHALLRLIVLIGKEVAKEAVSQTVHNLLDKWVLGEKDASNKIQTDNKSGQAVLSESGIYPGDMEIEIVREFQDGRPPVKGTLTFKNPVTMVRDPVTGKWKLNQKIIEEASKTSLLR